MAESHNSRFYLFDFLCIWPDGLYVVIVTVVVLLSGLTLDFQVKLNRTHVVGILFYTYL